MSCLMRSSITEQELYRMRQVAYSIILSIFSVTQSWRRLVGVLTLVNRYPTFFLAFSIPILWTLVLYRYGIGLSPDGIMYLKTASFMHYNGNYTTQITVWPPLYPFIISLFLYVTPFPATAAALATGVLLLCTLVLVALILKDILDRPFWELSVFGALLSLSCFWLPFYKAFSESAFVCFTVAHLYFIWLYLKTKKTRNFVLAAAAASMAALSRYSGYSIYPCLGLLGFYIVAGEKSPKKRATLVITLFLSLVPSVMWAIRNYRIDQSFHGIRGSSKSTIFEGIHKIVLNYNQELGYPLLALFIGCVVFLIYRINVGFTTRKAPSLLFVFEQYVLGLLISYGALIVYATANTDINAIGNRLVHLMYPISFVLIAAGVRQLSDFLPTQNLKKAVVLCSVACLIIGISTRVESLTASFSRISRIDKKQTNYFSVGFEKTRNAKKIANQMTQIIKKNRTILLAGIVNIPSYRMYRGHGYFYRKHVWSNPHIKQFRFDNIAGDNIAHSRKYNFQECNFNATFTYDGEPRTVLYRGVPNIKKFKNITSHFRKMMKKYHVSRAFVLESKSLKGSKWGIDMKKAIAESKGKSRLRVDTVFGNADFAIHRFSLWGSSKNNFPFSTPIFGLSAAAAQSRNPRNSAAITAVSLNHIDHSQTKSGADKCELILTRALSTHR